MKKTSGILFILCMCFAVLMGCQKKKEITSYFDSETNQNMRLNECSFEIPKEWEGKVDSSSNIATYKIPDGLVMVQYGEMDGSILDKNNRKTFLKSFVNGWEKVKFGEESKTKVCGDEAYKEVFDFSMDGESYNAKMILFDCNDAMMNFVISTVKNSDKDYSSDFDEIIDSIDIILPFKKTISEAEEVLEILQSADKCDFSTNGIDTLDNGTVMEMLIDSSNGTLMTLIGDNNENITMVHASSKDETGIVSVATMALMMTDTTSTNASDFLTNLSYQKLKQMGTDIDDFKTEVIDGVSYTISKSGDSEYLYTFDLKRDNENRKDYQTK